MLNVDLNQCQHDKAIDDTDYDLNELLEGMKDGEQIILTGFCVRCGRRVVRFYNPITVVDKDGE